MKRSTGPSLITSPANPQVKAIRQLASRPERERTGRLFVEGERFVRAVANAEALELLVVCPDLVEGDAQWQRLATEARIPVICLSARVYASLSRSSDPPGVGAVTRQPTVALPGDIGDGLVVAVAGAEIAGNLGTIIRTCEAVEAKALVAIGEETDPFHPAAVRASMGSIFRVPIVRCSWREFANHRRRLGWRLIGTSPGAALTYREVDLRGPIVLLQGSEQAGLTTEQLRACDAAARIPMAASIDSLNVAVAAGVVIYEAVAQRGGVDVPRHRR